mgnify:CR=1 FL=1
MFYCDCVLQSAFSVVYSYYLYSLYLCFSSHVLSTSQQHRSKRLTQPPERYSPGLFFTDSGEPTTYKEAINTVDTANWQVAIESEMRSVHENKTWDLVGLPRNRRALLCYRVFRLKLTAASSSPNYKACIVAKGFRKEYA